MRKKHDDQIIDLNHIFCEEYPHGERTKEVKNRL